MIEPSRRAFLAGAASFLAAPAIVRVSSLMSLGRRPFGVGTMAWHQRRLFVYEASGFYVTSDMWAVWEGLTSHPDFARERGPL